MRPLVVSAYLIQSLLYIGHWSESLGDKNAIKQRSKKCLLEALSILSDAQVRPGVTIKSHKSRISSVQWL